MLRPNEISELYALARAVTGAGQVVDLGTWLGGSTAALAAGVAANRAAVRGNVKVHAFDLFTVDTFSKRTKRFPEIQSREVGDSFLPAFLGHMGKWRDRVVVHEGDLLQQRWTSGPIELAHVDVMKNWELTNHVLAEFFPHLVPGRSIIVHQDFAHYWTGWIHLVMYRLRDYFVPVGHVRGATSFVFRLGKAVPAEVLRSGFRPEDFSEAEVAAAFAWSRGLLPADAVQRFSIDAAHAMFYHHQGDRARCIAILTEAERAEEEFKRAGHRGSSELRRVREMLPK